MAVVASDASVLGLSWGRFSTVPNKGQGMTWRAQARTTSSPIIRRKFKGVSMSLMEDCSKMKKLSRYSRVFTTNNALYESNGVLLDHYLEDTTRVLNAIFPDEERQQIAEGFWRVRMLPVQLILLNPRPVIEVRIKCKSRGEGYPPEIPEDVTKFLEIEIKKCVLEGLNFNPTDFNFHSKSVIYPDRRQPQRHRVRSRLEMNISYSLHPLFPFFPEKVVTSIFEQNLIPYMNRNLLRDYGKYQTEQKKKLFDIEDTEKIRNQNRHRKMEENK